MYPDVILDIKNEFCDACFIFGLEALPSRTTNEIRAVKHMALFFASMGSLIIFIKDVYELGFLFDHFNRLQKKGS